MRGDQRVNCVLVNCVLCLCFHCKHAAMQSHTKQCAAADRGEICIVYIQTSALSVFLGGRRV
ncbi:unnamed protein product, partial [Staurois parvus]